MTDEEIIDLADKAGITFVTQSGVASATVKWLQKFASLVAAKERERLAARQWQGLTDDEAVDLLPYGDWEIESTLKFARAIEAKLKEKNNA